MSYFYLSPSSRLFIVSSVSKTEGSKGDGSKSLFQSKIQEKRLLSRHVHLQFVLKYLDRSLLLVDVNELFDNECSENTMLFQNISNFISNKRKQTRTKWKRKNKPLNTKKYLRFSAELEKLSNLTDLQQLTRSDNSCANLIVFPDVFTSSLKKQNNDIKTPLLFCEPCWITYSTHKSNFQFG